MTEIYLKPTKDQEAFAGHLRPCPHCGKKPKWLIVESPNSTTGFSYKLVCGTFHIGPIKSGNWYYTIAKAGKSWNRRVLITRDYIMRNLESVSERLERGDEGYTPHEIIEWAACCSKSATRQKCYECPARFECLRVSTEFFKKIAIRASGFLEAAMGREEALRKFLSGDALETINTAADTLCECGNGVTDEMLRAEGVNLIHLMQRMNNLLEGEKK